MGGKPVTIKSEWLFRYVIALVTAGCLRSQRGNSRFEAGRALTQARTRSAPIPHIAPVINIVWLVYFTPSA